MALYKNGYERLVNRSSRFLQPLPFNSITFIKMNSTLFSKLSQQIIFQCRISHHVPGRDKTEQKTNKVDRLCNPFYSRNNSRTSLFPSPYLKKKIFYVKSRKQIKRNHKKDAHLMKTTLITINEARKVDNKHWKWKQAKQNSKKETNYRITETNWNVNGYYNLKQKQ